MENGLNLLPLPDTINRNHLVGASPPAAPRAAAGALSGASHPKRSLARALELLAASRGLRRAILLPADH
jgi:hypothetical protein